MEVEAPVPVPSMDLNFDSTNSSPYITAPSSPTRFGNFFFSAPTSPSHASPPSSSAPSDWEDRPAGTAPRKRGAFGDRDGFDEDFEFNFSGQLEKASFSPADELFYAGKIRPLKPPLALYQAPAVSSPRSPKSPKLSMSKEIEEAQTGEEPEARRRNRGRERTTNSSHQGYIHKGSRSLSPFRVSDMLLEEELEEASDAVKSVASSAAKSTKSPISSILSALSLPGYRKWKLKDLLLFRSVSEGRATCKGSPKGYDLLGKKETAILKNSSLRSSGSIGSGSGSGRRSGQVSAHEFHYTVNRAVSEELRRKTSLPYKHGLLGCLGFNPRVRDVSRGFASMTRGRS